MIIIFTVRKRALENIMTINEVTKDKVFCDRVALYELKVRKRSNASELQCFITQPPHYTTVTTILLHYIYNCIIIIP
jgi:hypothetical protein